MNRLEFLDRTFGLTGKVVLVTGGSRGIGAAIAQGLAAAGAKVTALARSPRPDTLPAEIAYRTLDVTDLDAVRAAVGAIAAETKRIDVLVNAAGVTEWVNPDEPNAAVARFARTVATNLTSVYAACIAAADHMTDGGSIINVTSIASVRGFPGNPGYVAAKGGLRSLTMALAMDLAPKGIRVNSLAPGYVRTAMTEASYQDPVRRAHRTRHTLQKRWGTPEDVVGAALFLASPASAYVTGTDLFVDGGWTASGMTSLND